MELGASLGLVCIIGIAIFNYWDWELNARDSRHSDIIHNYWRKFATRRGSVLLGDGIHRSVSPVGIPQYRFVCGACRRLWRR